METVNNKKQFNGFLALFLSLVFGIISVNGIVTDGKIKAFDLIYFLENNFLYLLVLLISSFLFVTYVVINYMNAIKILKQKEWVNIFYLLWIFSVISPVLKHHYSLYLRLLPVLLPIISIYILLKYHSSICGKSIKEYLTEEFNPKKTANR